MRWIFRIVGALVLVAVLAIAALFVIPAERIAALAGDQFERATGRSMTISGDVRPSIWPTLGVRAEGVVIGNPAWVEDGPLKPLTGAPEGIAEVLLEYEREGISHLQVCLEPTNVETIEAFARVLEAVDAAS